MRTLCSSGATKILPSPIFPVLAALQIASMLARLGIKSEFAAGLRITDAATIEIVEMVLAGSINKQIVSHINEAGGKAVGLSGKDGNMVTAVKATRTMVDPDSNIEKIIDLGFVGEPDKVDLTLLNQLIGYELIPVLAPLAIGAVSDAFGHIAYGFSLATGFAALLFVGALLNWLLNPTRARLQQLDASEYRQALPS